jgi:DNA modification methylase
MVKKINSHRYNELTGREWLQYSFSIWRDIRKTDEERSMKHPAMFPSALAEKVIKTYTRENDVVLDPFAGIGTTLIAACDQNRKAVGMDLSEEFVKSARQRLRGLNGALVDREIKIINADARQLKEYVNDRTIDLCVTSPPYWDVLNMRRTADGKRTKNYGNDKTDLGNINDYEQFLSELMQVFSAVYDVLKTGGHCVIVVMDLRKKDKFYPLHSDLAGKMEGAGFTFEDIIIWDRQHEYNNMKPLGWPSVFRVNKVHEYVLIFRKRK